MRYSFFIGRFQPWHEGHAAIVDQLLDEGKNVCIAIRDTLIDEDNPHSAAVRMTIIRSHFIRRNSMSKRIKIIVIPDIDDVVCGRTPGYGFIQVHLTPELEAISGTAIRAGK
jgi:nicotinamide mononucleotide adenylyltransferase